jgi:molybdate transport system regulatory protein
VRTRLRVQSGEDIALGPGKVDLLALVKETGSIRHAAERMHMSYMRAWTLIRTMNRCFKQPLVETARGGSHQGGARLTAVGEEALRLYREMDQACIEAVRPHWNQLVGLLRAGGGTE